MSEMTLEQVKKSLSSFADELYEIPNHFKANVEYLNGIPKRIFEDTFFDYRNIVFAMYKKASQYPMQYGISHINKQGQEVIYSEFSSQLNYMEKLAQIHYFIDNICKSSVLSNNKLDVDVAKLTDNMKTYPKIKKPDMLVERFCEHGFIFEGADSHIQKAESLTISYPQNDTMLRVIKSFSECAQKQHGMIFDYAHFNVKIMALSKKELLPLVDLYVYDALSFKAQKFLGIFNHFMNKLKYTYGKSATSGFCWGISQFAYSKATQKNKVYVCRLYHRGDTLIVRLFLKNVDTYAHYIERAPDYIQDAFINDFGKCHYCKAVCLGRKTYHVHGVEYEKCQGAVFEFHCLNIEAIPYYIDLIQLSKTKGKTETII